MRGWLAILKMSWRYWSRGESLSYQRVQPPYVERNKVSQVRFYKENQ